MAENLVYIGLIVMPLVATVIIGVSFERYFERHTPMNGHKLKKYFES